MPQYSIISSNRLRTAHPLLQHLFNEVIKKVDILIACGYRGEEEQNKAYDLGRSKIRYPLGKHNSLPSLAVDIYPYPYNWVLPECHTNIKKFYYVSGIIKAISWQLEIPVRWGGDWDSDNDLFDQNFYDLPHWQLIL